MSDLLHEVEVSHFDAGRCVFNSHHTKKAQNNLRAAGGAGSSPLSIEASSSAMLWYLRLLEWGLSTFRTTLKKNNNNTPWANVMAGVRSSF
jgi:hypothetical protein